VCEHLQLPPERVQKIAALAILRGWKIVEVDGYYESTRIEPPKPPEPRPQEPRPPREPARALEHHKTSLEVQTLREENRRLLEELRLAEQRQRFIDGVGHRSIPPVVPRELRSGLREATAIVQCSDWHVEEPVEPEKVNGLNEFNLAIADHRITRLVDGTKWLLGMHRERFLIRDLVLWLGGDLFSGHIHEDLVESVSMTPIESSDWLLIRIKQMIDEFLLDPLLEQLIVPCTVGNHGRTTKKMRVQTRCENSYEWLVYRILARQYEDNPRVRFEVPRSELLYLNVYETSCRFTHGDSFSFAGGVGGLTIPLAKAVKGWNDGIHADLTFMGHWHQRLTLSNAIVNSSLIGFSPLSIRYRASYEPPTQNYTLIDSKRGRCADHPIWLDEKDEEATRPGVESQPEDQSSDTGENPAA
jgi:hypothetical protein